MTALRFKIEIAILTFKMRVKRSLDTIDLQAAALLAQKKTEREICNSCGKSRSWLQSLKQREDFQQEVERISQELNASTREIIKDSFDKNLTEKMNQIDLFAFNCKKVNFKSLLLATETIKILEKKIVELETEELSLEKITRFLQDVAIINDNGAELLAHSFNLDMYAKKFLIPMIKEDENS